MTRWTNVALADMADVQGGIQKQAKRHPTKNKYPFLRVANVARGRLILDEVHEVELFGNELERYRLRQGDLLVVEGNGSPDQIGRAAVWDDSIPDCVHQNHLIRVRPRDGLLPEYLGLAWNSPAVSSQVRSTAASTSGLYTLSTSKLKRIAIPYCSPDEQRRVVDLVEDQMSRLDAARSYTQSAHERVRAWRLSSSRQVMPGLDARQHALGDLLVHSIGGVWGSVSGEDDLDVDVIRVTELRPGGRIDPSTAAARSVSKSQFANRQLQDGDLLLEKSGGGPRQPVGRVGIIGGLERSSVCSNFMQLMRPDPALVRPSYLHFFLSDLHERGGTAPLQKASTNIRNIKSSEYVKLLVPVPSLREQDRILASIGQQADVVNNLLIAITAADLRERSLRASFLTAAFSGALTGRTKGLNADYFSSATAPEASQTNE